jgi:copper transporter 1
LFCGLINCLCLFTGLVGACIAVFVLAMLYEGLKVVREMLLQKSMLQNSKYAVSSNGTSSQDTMVISHKNIGYVC